MYYDIMAEEEKKKEEKKITLVFVRHCHSTKQERLKSIFYDMNLKLRQNSPSDCTDKGINESVNFGKYVLQEIYEKQSIRTPLEGIKYYSSNLWRAMQTVKSICEGAEDETQISEISKSSGDIRVLCYISEQLNYFNKYFWQKQGLSPIDGLTQPVNREGKKARGIEECINDSTSSIQSLSTTNCIIDFMNVEGGKKIAPVPLLNVYDCFRFNHQYLYEIFGV